MNGGIKVAAAAVVLGALVWFVGFGADPTLDDGGGQGTTAAGAVAAAAGEADRPGAATDRESVAPVAAEASWLEHPYLFELDVLVLDRTGLPVRGHRVALGPVDGPLNDADERTDDAGRVHIAWGARVPSGEVVLAERGGLLRRVPVQHGRPTALCLLGQSSGSGQVRFRSGTIRLAITGSGGSNGQIVMSGVDELRMQRGLHPHAAFVTELSRAGQGTVPTNATFELSTLLADGAIRLGSGTVQMTNDPAPPLPRIAGTVFGADGRPAAKVPVVLLGSSPQPIARTETDDGGQFALDEVKAGEFTVRAGGEASGLATAPAVTTTGTTPVTLNLTCGVTVRGRALGPDGSPLAKARVGFRASDDGFCDETETGADGSFTLANLPGSPGTVTVRLVNRGRPFPVACARDVLANTDDLELRAGPIDGALQLEPVLPDDLAGLPEVRLWNLDLGVGAVMPQPDGARRPGALWRLDNLPAGWYRVELLHPATGRIDAGRHWVDGRSACDLGRVALPDPATAHLDIRSDGSGAPAEGRFELYSLRPDFDRRLTVPGAAADFQLAPGDGAAFWNDAAGTLHVERFTATKGEAVAIAIGG